jgi:L-alanine-DL-glutamate epimerase-like enolase superfamily enzyme
MTVSIRAFTETFPIKGTFVISRGTKTEAVVVVAEVSDGSHTGRGECVPYRRNGETVEGVLAAISAGVVDGGHEALRLSMAPGAARNALDCALWDLEAKKTGRPAWQLAGLIAPKAVLTAFTLSLDTPERMAAAARNATASPLLKVKLGGDGDPERLHAIRSAVPTARLTVDANEGWSEQNFAANMRSCMETGVELIEQPLPADADELLRSSERLVPVCADESVHVTADLEGLTGKYDAVNVKLDKAGGLTEALDLARAARRRGFRVMVGCMVGTSLGMAPAMLAAQEADYVDLDGPLWLTKDRAAGLVYSGGMVSPPEPSLWG